MIVCSPVKACTKVISSGHLQMQMTSNVYHFSSIPSSSCCLFFRQGKSRTRYSRIAVSKTSSCFSQCSFQACQRAKYMSDVSSLREYLPSMTLRRFMSPRSSQEAFLNLSSWYQNASIRVLLPKKRLLSNLKSNVGTLSWPRGCGAAGIISGLLICYSTSDSAHAEAAENQGDRCDDSSSGQYSHGKKVHTDYSVIGIPGDGRCLFRSVAHGACLRSGKPAPSESHQKQLADELRAMVADEFIRRREESEWFIEGDFDAYVSQMRKPHVWGGEPELLMLSHVLRMPITVYMRDDKYGGLISIAEYGQDYGKDNPVRILYNGSGHYDALFFPPSKVGRSRF